MALITLDNGLDHTRPNSFGPKGLAELDAAIDTALERDDVVADRTHRQAVHPRGGRRHHRDATHHPPRAGARGRALRAPGVRQARRRPQAVLRIHQRTRHRRRTRGGPQLHLPHGDRIGAGGGVQRVLPRHPPRLGRHLAAAQPRGCRPRGQDHRRERPEQQPDAARPGGRAGGYRGRDVRGRRLPRTLPRLGRPGGQRAGRGAAAGGRPRRRLGRRRGTRPCVRRRQAARRRAGRLPRARHHRGGEDDDEGRRLRCRGRRARRSRDDRGVPLRAVRVRPGPAPGEEAGGRARQVPRPPGHQGRDRRRRTDGEPARPAVRPSVAGTRSAHGHRRRAGREGPRVRPGGGRQARGQGPASVPTWRTGSRPSSAGPPTRAATPTATSYSRPSSRR